MKWNSFKRLLASIISCQKQHKEFQVLWTHRKQLRRGKWYTASQGKVYYLPMCYRFCWRIKNVTFHHLEPSRTRYSGQNLDSGIATFSVRSLVNMFSQNMSNVVVHKSEILRAVCETVRIWLPRELVYIIFESESRSVLSGSLWPHGPYSPWHSPGQNTGVGSYFLLQGIFSTQVSCIAGGFFTTWAMLLLSCAVLC